MMKIQKLLALSMIAVAAACGGGDDGDGGGGGGGGGGGRVGNGSLVFTFPDDFNGSTESLVHVLDVPTGRDSVFVQAESAEDDVNASREGLIAQMSEGGDQYFVTVTDKTGTVIHEWGFELEFSFLMDGPQISPDGSKIAFTVNYLPPGDDEDRDSLVIVANADGSNFSSSITLPGAQSVSWTPDGRLIGTDFTDTLEPASFIFVSNAELSDFPFVNDAPLDDPQYPTMTPDGRYVVYGLDLGELYALEVATQNISQLTSDGLDQFRPAISPDGRWLAFQQQCCGGPAPVPTLYIIPFDPSRTVNAGYGDLEPYHDSNDEIVAVGGRMGWF